MSEPGSQNQDLIEQLVADCLACAREEREAAIVKACTENPEAAVEIRRLITALDRVGLTEEERPQALPDALGDFKLLRRIGGGGMGEVWLAEQQSLGRRVALKIMRPGMVFFPHSRERFQREVEALTRLEHPAICRVYDAGEVEGTPFIAMEFLEGRTLAQVLAGERKESKKGSTDRDSLIRKIGWIEDIARGLHEAHEQGFVHRDVKPGNLMITKEGRAVLLDFGLARVVQADARGLTLTGDRLGTPAYMAPEQISGSSSVDRRCDVYALGVTLYEALSLGSPFQGPSREALYREILGGEASRLSRRRRGIPREVEVVVATAMDADPDRRYQDALIMAEDLARLRRGEAIQARGLGPLQRVCRWVRRHRLASAVLLMLGLALGASLVVQAALDRALLRTRVQAWIGSGRGDLARGPAMAPLAALIADRALEVAKDPGDRCQARSLLHRACTMAQYNRVLAGHAGSNVYGLAVTRDGDWAATGGLDMRLKLWDLGSRNNSPVWSRRAGSMVRKVAFCGPDEKLILAAESSGRLNLWNREGKLVDSFVPGVGLQRLLAHVVLSPDGTTLLAGFRKCARVFSITATGFRPLGGELPHEDFVGFLALDMPRGVFATGIGSLGFSLTSPIAPHPIRLWRLTDQGPRLMHRLVVPAEGALLFSGGFSHDGRYLVAGSRGLALLFDLQEPEGPPRILPAGAGKVDASFLRPDRHGLRLVTAAYSDGRITIWNEKGERLPSPGKVACQGYEIHFSRKGDRFAIPCADGKVRVFSVPAAGSDLEVEHLWTLPLSSSNLDRVRFRAGGRRLVTTSADGKLRCAELDGPPRALHTGETGAINNMVAYSVAGGEHLVTAPSLGHARVWSQEGEVLFRWPVSSGGNYGWYPAVLSRDRRLLGAFVGDKAKRTSGVEVWRIATGTKVATFSSDLFLLAATFLPGTGEMMVYSQDVAFRQNRLWVWNYGTGERQRIDGTIDTPGFRLQGRPLIASPDGLRVLFVHSFSMLVRRNLGSPWKCMTFGFGDGSCCTAGAFSPGGLVALGGPEGWVRLYDKAGKLLPIRFDGCAGKMTWLSFSPDGRLLAGSSKDGTARLWRSDGTTLAVLRAGDDPIEQITFSADGRHLYTAHHNGYLRRWFAVEEDLRDHARAWYEKVITPEQRALAESILAR